MSELRKQTKCAHTCPNAPHKGVNAPGYEVEGTLPVQFQTAEWPQAPFPYSESDSQQSSLKHVPHMPFVA